MKILCVNHFLQYVNRGLLEAMTDHGHDVNLLPLGLYPSNEQYRLLKQALTEYKPDYIFTPGWSINFFDTEMFLNTIKGYKIPHIYWATEDPLFFDEVSMVFAPHSHYVFTTASECVEKYNKMGIPSSTLTFGFNPKLFHRMKPQKEYSHDLVLLAANYFWFSEDKSFRRKAIQDIVEPLAKEGYDIKIWGDSWTNPAYGFRIQDQFYGGNCPYSETPSVYSSAKIVLGIQSVDSSPTQTSVRTYEVLGSGAFHLTCYTPSHENLFKNHKHLVWSKSADETVELVDYYLKHEDERRKIALQGQAEVFQKHTYYHRLEEFDAALKKYFGSK